MTIKNQRMKTCIIIFLLLLLLGASFFAGRMTSFSELNAAPLNYTDAMGAIDYGEETYVIGHKSPDTDTVASAITYANLKKQLGINCKPVVSGRINNETRFVLEQFGVSVPDVLENASGKNMILVDHSAYTQMIDGMEEAHVVELLDHHGLGNIETSDPVFIKDMAVGATATIVYISYIENNVEFDKPTAGLLVSAILSDTNGLTTTTTTDADRHACEYLARIAEIEDVDAYYQQLREHAESYDGMTDEEIFYSDYKEYEMSGVNVGITAIRAAEGQLETLCRKMQEFMQTHYEEQEMEHLYAMINDEYGDQTILLFYGEGSDIVAEKAFGKNEDGETVITPLASRKKDVVPPLETVYSEKE